MQNDLFLVLAQVLEQPSKLSPRLINFFQSKHASEQFLYFYGTGLFGLAKIRCIGYIGLGNSQYMYMYTVHL